MSDFDVFGGTDVTGTRDTLSARGRIEAALDKQLRIANGEKVIVAKSVVGSWYDESTGRATFKVSGVTLAKRECSFEDYKAGLMVALGAVKRGEFTETVDYLQKKLDEKRNK